MYGRVAQNNITLHTVADIHSPVESALTHVLHLNIFSIFVAGLATCYFQNLKKK